MTLSSLIARTASLTGFSSNPCPTSSPEHHWGLKMEEKRLASVLTLSTCPFFIFRFIATLCLVTFLLGSGVWRQPVISVVCQDCHRAARWLAVLCVLWPLHRYLGLVCSLGLLVLTEKPQNFSHSKFHLWAITLKNLAAIGTATKNQGLAISWWWCDFMVMIQAGGNWRFQKSKRTLGI